MDKSVKRKLTLAVAIISLVVFFGGQLYLVQTAPPENKARMVSWVRESPAWQFYGVMGLFSIPFLIAMYIMVNQKRWSRLATSGSIRNAKKVALSLWRVDHTLKELERQVRERENELRALGHHVRSRKNLFDYLEPEYDSWVVLQFQHMSWGRWAFILSVRPGHPDIELFRKLKAGDIVEFEPLTEGMECALEHELCGYLRIKSIS
jgi:hypothetical protein